MILPPYYLVLQQASATAGRKSLCNITGGAAAVSNVMRLKNLRTFLPLLFRVLSDFALQVTWSRKLLRITEWESFGSWSTLVTSNAQLKRFAVEIGLHNQLKPRSTHPTLRLAIELSQRGSEHHLPELDLMPKTNKAPRYGAVGDTSREFCAIEMKASAP